MLHFWLYGCMMADDHTGGWLFPGKFRPIKIPLLSRHTAQYSVVFVTSTIQKSNRNDNLITTWNIEHISILNWWRFKSKRLNGSTWGCVRDQMFWPLIVIYYQTVRLQCRFQKSKQLSLRPDFVEMIYFEMLFADKRMQIFSCKHLSQSSSSKCFGK